MRWLAASILGLLVALASSPARADGTARLVYEAPLQCPDERALRDSVAMRLGYDPFTRDADREVAVVIQAAPGRARATVRLTADGAPAGLRELEDTGSCDDLLDSLSLAVSIAIDPARALGPAPDPPEVTQDEPEPWPPPSLRARPTAPHPQAPQPAPEPAPEPWRVGAALTVYGTAGLTPEVSGGAGLDLFLRHDAWSLSLGGFAELPTGADVQDGRVASLRAAAAIAGCLHLDWLAACALAQVGGIVGWAEDVAEPREAAAPFLALGGEARAAWSVVEGLALGLFARLLLTPTPTELRIDERAVWSTGWIGGALGVSAAFDGVVQP